MMRFYNPVSENKKCKRSDENLSCAEQCAKKAKQTVHNGHRSFFDFPKMPEKSTSNNDKLIVLMDIDHTMIKTNFFYSWDEADVYTASLPRDKNGNTVEYIQKEDHPVYRRGIWHVNLRPGLREFIQEVASFAELHIFTAGNQRYAENVALLLDPNEWYFSSDRCWSSDGPYVSFSEGGHHYKHISELPLGRKDLSRVVLIDDKQDHQKTNPGNMYRIARFEYETDDYEFDCALDFIKRNLKDCDDVRPIIRKREKEEASVRDFLSRFCRCRTVDQSQINRYLSSEICS